MAHRIETLADILHPVTVEEFFAEYYDRKVLHVPAPDPDKFADVMSWAKLSEILNMTALWSPASLQLVLDRQPVAAREYCRDDLDRENRPTLQPDAEKVTEWMRRGASLVLNYIDTLSPELAAVANAVERGIGGKLQSNLYCSWQQRRAFDTHMDTHDVFALHIAGEKDWNIYEGRLENPIAHEMFKSLDRDYHMAQRGSIESELTLRPGDFLYLPRGKYHDALASSEGCIHLTFGITRVIGFDLLNLVYNYAAQESGFRANFPLLSGDAEADRAAVRNHIEALAGNLGEIVRSDALLDDMMGFIGSFMNRRGGYDLPGDVIGSRSNSVEFALTSDGFSIVRIGGQDGLKGPRGAVPIPAGLIDAVRWVVERKHFSRADLAAAFPDMPEAGREKLLGDLSSMQVIAPA